MSYYCPCTPEQPQAFPDEVVLTDKSRMRCISTGAQQFLELGGPEHYPMVDIYECPNCHSRVVHEGYRAKGKQ